MASLGESDIYLVLDPRVNSQPEGSPEAEQLIREICHDLRQPLATIKALAEAAATIPGVPGEVRSFIDQVIAETRRMSELTGRLLGESLALSSLDAVRVAQEVAGSARAVFQGQISVEADPGVTVVADEPSLRRALANLVENATRAAGPGGRVSVTVRRSGEWVDYEVNDSGPGFGAGPRGSASLGLAIVDRIAQTHGGSLQIGRSRFGGVQATLKLPAPPVDRRRRVRLSV